MNTSVFFLVLCAAASLSCGVLADDMAVQIKPFTHRALRQLSSRPPPRASPSPSPSPEAADPADDPDAVNGSPDAPDADEAEDAPLAPPPPKAPRPPQPSLLSGGGGSGMLSGSGCSDVQALFDTNNMYRAWHQAPPMAWDVNLARESAAYAAELAAESCGLTHSNDALSGKVGENLYSVVSFPKPDATCKVAVDVWYSEESRYEYDTTKPLTVNWPRGVGHFTAMVWKGSQRFGCGMALRNQQLGNSGLQGGCKVIVCRYLAPGNQGSDQAFRDNVLPRD